MTAFLHKARAGGVRGAALAGVALAGGACLLITGCSGQVSSQASSAGVAHNAVAAPAAPGTPGGEFANGARLTRLSPAVSQSIIYTANLTVRARDVAAAAAKATALAEAAGGYVSSEHTTTDRAHPANAAVYLQLKIPVGSYQASLASLGRLGVSLSQSQQAQDVTQTVADVASRVRSAQAAIAQLRKLLDRAGSVSSLLEVQNQINAEEASLETLQAQQRALAHQTSYATISLQLVSNPAAAVKHHHRAGGFTGGLAAGWRALRAVISWLLTVAGAALPFALPVALLIGAGYWARQWHIRRRTGTSQAG